MVKFVTNWCFMPFLVQIRYSISLHAYSTASGSKQQTILIQHTFSQLYPCPDTGETVKFNRMVGSVHVSWITGLIKGQTDCFHPNRPQNWILPFPLYYWYHLLSLIKWIPKCGEHKFYTSTKSIECSSNEHEINYSALVIIFHEHVNYQMPIPKCITNFNWLLQVI